MIMNIYQLGLMAFGLLSFETTRAENNVLKGITTRPRYKVAEGPLVSVIIPAYNEENYLPAVLSALPNQTYDNLEVIVVDNLSEDRTVEIARNMGALVVTNPEYNLSLSRNMGAAAASGQIFVFLDADTIPEQTLIEHSVNELRKGAAIVLANQCSSDDHIHSLARVAMGLFYVFPRSSYVAVDSNAFWSIGGFNESCLPQENCSEERDFAARVSQIGRRAYLRFNYSATSARRTKAEGLFHEKLFEHRAIREEAQVSAYGRRHEG